MRYKISLRSKETYRKARKLLENRVTIFVENEKRLYFSVSELPSELIVKLESIGATISRDHQYDPEKTA